MWRIATLLVAVSVASVQAGIDYTRCRNYYNDFGHVSCDQGFVPVALCTSGRNPDCSGFYTQMRCCQETSFAEEVPEEVPQEVPETRACFVKSGGSGVEVYCDSGLLPLHICTSGENADCNNGHTNLQCCDNHSQITDSSCVWLYGGYGQTVACPTNRVIIGVCSSGSEPDCDGGFFYTGIYCCTVL